MGDVTGLVLPRPARRIAGPEEPHPPETPRGASHPRPWWQFWRSPPDQPPWARPALLAVAALASFSYFWGIGNATLETFYGGAVRSMSESWRNFFFGAFDPWGTVTLDKLPGAFWVQALSVRAFGFHVWSVVLPQALEGTLTVLVLFRAVRRVAGAAAGLVAAIVLAVTPVVILLDRGNVSDTLLILLLVLAADAVTAATRTGRVTHLLVASLWVGLAFQAKMLEAWVVLPALWGAYVLAAPNPVLARRLGHALVCAAVAVVVSLSYMTVVTMVPTADRPYVDGSCNDSLFTQVFEYNGAGRTNGAALEGTRCNPTPAAVASVAGGGTETTPLPDGPGRFLSGGFARDVDLMLVPAVVALGGVFMSRRRAPRTDPIRAAAVLWGGWLFLAWSAIASSPHLNGYYLAALAPPIAALCGLGFALAWRWRRHRVTRAVVGTTVVATSVYAVWLLPAGVGVRPWVLASTAVGAVAALAVLTGSSWRRRGGNWAGIGVVLASCALLAGSLWASATSVAAGLGPFDAPYQAAAITAREHAAHAGASDLAAGLARVAARVSPSMSVITDETSAGSALPILDTGREFLPVGGFTGRAPTPTLAQFVEYVRSGRISDVLVTVTPRTRNPDMLWALAHCAPFAYHGPDSPVAGRAMRFVQCRPADAQS